MIDYVILPREAGGARHSKLVDRNASEGTSALVSDRSLDLTGGTYSVTLAVAWPTVGLYPPESQRSSRVSSLPLSLGLRTSVLLGSNFWDRWNDHIGPKFRHRSRYHSLLFWDHGQAVHPFEIPTPISRRKHSRITTLPNTIVMSER